MMKKLYLSKVEDYLYCHESSSVHVVDVSFTLAECFKAVYMYLEYLTFYVFRVGEYLILAELLKVLEVLSLFTLW